VDGCWKWVSDDDPTPTDVDRICEPFPHTEAFNPLHLIPTEPKEEDFETAEAFYNASYGWQEQWDEVVESETTVGLVYLCNLGCALRHAMVVSGPARGQMWADRIADGRALEPLFDHYGSPLTFAGWYKRWLEEAEREFGVTTFPDSIAANTARKL
jgi:hypothetical protein